ncbi:MAG: hypothetical protein ACRDTZ_18875, partial [Pseudonocardiaceae bacterium]
EQVLTAGDRQLLAQSVDPGSGEHLHANATHWFERELLQYSAIIETPGGHAAAGTHPAEFGRTLQHALSTCGADDPRPGSDGIPVRR